jgi:hypothetical protein
MPFHVIAFRESRSAAATLDTVAPVPDPVGTIIKETYIVPATYNKIVALNGGAVEATEMKISAPSIRDEGDFQVEPIETQDYPTIEQKIIDLRTNPLALESGEGLSVLASNTAPAAGQTADVYCVTFLADGPIAPVTGRMITVKATATGTLTAGQWTNLPIMFAVDLPVGTYAIVGMRAESPGLIAARLVSPEVPYRPGVLGRHSATEEELTMFRYGRFGEFLRFAHNRPPTVDFLSVSADSNPVVYLDLVKVA